VSSSFVSLGSGGSACGHRPLVVVVVRSPRRGGVFARPGFSPDFTADQSSPDPEDEESSIEPITIPASINPIMGPQHVVFSHPLSFGVFRPAPLMRTSSPSRDKREAEIGERAKQADANRASGTLARGRPFRFSKEFTCPGVYTADEPKDEEFRFFENKKQWFTPVYYWRIHNGLPPPARPSRFSSA